MDGYLHGSLNVCMYVCMDGSIDCYVERWMDGQMD